jgi:hypothetical protein
MDSFLCTLLLKVATWVNYEFRARPAVDFCPLTY